MPEEAHGYWLPGQCLDIEVSWLSFPRRRESISHLKFQFSMDSRLRGNDSCKKLGAQLKSLNLTRRGFWQFRYDLDPARIFERRECAFYVLLQDFE